MSIEFLDPRLSALIAAVFISFARLLYKAALQYIGVGISTVIMSLVSVIVGYIFLKMEGKVDSFPLYACLLFVGVGLSANLAGRYFSLVSINLVGLSRTSILMQTSLVWSAAFAMLFLNEEVNFYVFCGTMAVMFGSILLVYEKDSNYSKVPFTHFLVPVVTAITFALAHILGKLGLAIVDSAPFAQTVSNATSFVAMFMIFVCSKEFKIGGWKKMHPVLMVSVGALFNAMAAFFFWTALRTGDIVQVLPINRLNVLMIIFLSWVFFRKQESITKQVVVGGVMAVVGAFFVALGK